MSVEDGIPEGGQATPPEPSHDWEKDYKELQATYTQSQQRVRELERYEQDPQAYYQLGAKHGVEFNYEDPTPDPGVDPHIAQMQQELAEQRQWREQVESERQAANYERGRQEVIGQHNAWASEAGVELDDFDHAAILQAALDSGAKTLDDAKAVFDTYVERNNARDQAKQAAWEEARKRPRVPTPPTGGTTASGTPNWSGMSEADINQTMADMVQAQRQ